MNALVVAYFGSQQFKSLSSATQATYRGIIENFRVTHGEKRVRTLQSKHVARMMAEKAATPAAANNLLRMLRMLMRYAIVNDWRRDDPTAGQRAFRIRNGGFHTWSESEIAQFEARHPVGTRARLALALLLYTAQRRSDVVRMGRQHIRDGVLTIRQQKTGATVEIPLHSHLRAVLSAARGEHLTFLVTSSGKSFTPAGFGNWFRERCNEAKLPQGCSAHGLRKAASRRLAEAGCTAHEIMAITGHQTLKEVTRYTIAADRAGLARKAVAKLKVRTTSVKPNRKV
jgi:integrase